MKLKSNCIHFVALICLGLNLTAFAQPKMTRLEDLGKKAACNFCKSADGQLAGANKAKQ